VGVEVRWRPFNLREILIEQNNTGFTKNAVKMNYFWRDVERRARRHNIPFAGRAPYPADPDLLALRVGLISAQEG
jgi:2-hydroxychromene-2-carboxylate isomerase